MYHPHADMRAIPEVMAAILARYTSLMLECSSNACTVLASVPCIMQSQAFMNTVRWDATSVSPRRPRRNAVAIKGFQSAKNAESAKMLLVLGDMCSMLPFSTSTLYPRERRRFGNDRMLLSTLRHVMVASTSQLWMAIRAVRGKPEYKMLSYVAEMSRANRSAWSSMLFVVPSLDDERWMKDSAALARPSRLSRMSPGT